MCIRDRDSGDLLLSHMRGQAEIAMETADVIIFLTDVRQGLVDADYQVADMLRLSLIHICYTVLANNFCIY